MFRITWAGRSRSITAVSFKGEAALVHEVRHHNEFLAGADDLLYYDDDQISAYLKCKGFTIK